jgi:N-acetylneuraminate synthase
MTYIIAEIGANHNGSMATAQKLIDEAKKAGVNAVKFQSWTPESLYSKEYLRKNISVCKDLRKHSLSISKLRYLAKYTEGLDFICSVFSRQEVDDLEDVVDLYKIASMDLNNVRLLKYIAKKKKPVILSVGMGNRKEVVTASKILSAYNVPLTLLYCVSLYPTKPDQINLKLMGLLKNLAQNIGYSDHTEGITISLAAVALGANCIEKHFTLDKTQDGWDHKISADPEEMAELVKKSKQINEALNGYPRADIREQEKMRRSAVANRLMRAGHVLEDEDIIYRRPGTGLFDVIGKRLKVDVAEGHMFTGEEL